jgi:hypothetical protein
MKKRIAYVGLSTPVGYDYLNQASRTKADISSSPNPVLDSPFGLFLLFDEIWFLTRSLCPDNLRSAPFVKFLDEINDFTFINDLQVNRMVKELSKIEREMYDQDIQLGRINCETVIKNLDVDWEIGLDNHTHGLKLGDGILGGNPTLDNLLFDMEIIKLLDEDNIELITNSYTQSWFESEKGNFREMEFAETIIIDNIPNYLTSKGPYHPCVEEARDNSFLKDFRKWITSQPLHTDVNELNDIKKEVEEAIRKSQDEIFLKAFNSKGHFKSVGKAMVGDAVGILIPGASTAGTAIEETINFFHNRKRRWQAFVVSIRHQNMN